MLRAIQKLTCGAIGRLLRPITAPGLIVSTRTRRC